MSDFDQVIIGRRSVGKVGSDPIDRDEVRRLIELATHAPTHHLREPWRFVVLQGGARARTGRAHGAAYARTHPDASQEALDREARRLLRAPVVIVAIVRSVGRDAVERREDRDAVAAAVQNLLLAAHARGLGAMWRTGAMPDEPEVRAELAVGDDEDIVGFIYLGRPPAVDPPARPRRPVDDVTDWRA